MSKLSSCDPNDNSGCKYFLVIFLNMTHFYEVTLILQVNRFAKLSNRLIKQQLVRYFAAVVAATS